MMKKVFILLFLLLLAAAGFIKLTYWDYYAALRRGAATVCDPGRPIPLTLQEGRNWPSVRLSIPKLYLLPVPELIANIWGIYLKKNVPAELIVIAVERKSFLPMFCAAGKFVSLSDRDSLEKGTLINMPSNSIAVLDRLKKAAVRVDNTHYPDFDIYRYAFTGKESAGNVVEIFVARDGSALQVTCPHPKDAPLRECVFITKVTDSLTVDYLVPSSDIMSHREIDARVRSLVRGFMVE